MFPPIHSFSAGKHLHMFRKQAIDPERQDLIIPKTDYDP